jgi:hypothetical protein
VASPSDAGAPAPAGSGAPAGPGTAGHSLTPLPRKLGIGPGDSVLVIGAPDWLADLLSGLPEVAALHTDLAAAERHDVIVAFVTERAELEADLPRLRSVMAPACGLWVAWPKRAARVPTDMTDGAVREIALPTGLVDNKVCAIDATWTALRLVIRRESRPPAARPRRPAGR